jgi:hypothetical protein
MGQSHADAWTCAQLAPGNTLPSGQDRLSCHRTQPGLCEQPAWWWRGRGRGRGRDQEGGRRRRRRRWWQRDEDCKWGQQPQLSSGQQGHRQAPAVANLRCRRRRRRCFKALTVQCRLRKARHGPCLAGAAGAGAALGAALGAEGAALGAVGWGLGAGATGAGGGEGGRPATGRWAGCCPPVATAAAWCSRAAAWRCWRLCRCRPAALQSA